MKKDQSITLFGQSTVRRHWDEQKEEWYFSVVDVIAILTDSTNPQVYWRVFKKRLIDEGAGETVTNCNGLKMIAPDGRQFPAYYKGTKGKKLENEIQESIALALQFKKDYPRNHHCYEPISLT